MTYIAVSKVPLKLNDDILIRSGQVFKVVHLNDMDMVISVFEKGSEYGFMVDRAHFDIYKAPDVLNADF